MKNKICILLAICCMAVAAEKSFSQNYLSLFGDTSTTWDIIVSGACDGTYSETMTVTGDTIINTHTYKVIDGPSGFLREDTAQGKAWFYDSVNNTEYLVMDLSLSIGDTFHIYDINNVPHPFEVDSVYYVNGKKYVQLNAWVWLCIGNEKITFVEGNGTTAGFSYQRHLYYEEVSFFMLCHHKDGVKVFGNTLFQDTCYVYSVGIPKNTTSIIINIFPNPTSSKVFVKLPVAMETSKARIVVYNALGEIVKQQIAAGANNILDIATLDAGIYFVTVKSPGKGFKAEKLVVRK